jgi:hypothetical protein
MAWRLPVDDSELELALPVRVSHLQEATLPNCVLVEEAHALLALPNLLSDRDSTFKYNMHL